jgi:hypothetical protein
MSEQEKNSGMCRVGDARETGTLRSSRSPQTGDSEALQVRMTSALRLAIEAAVKGGVRSYVDAYPHAAGIGVHSLTKRITGQLWGVLKTHRDVRRGVGSFPEELVADLLQCRHECGEKSRIINQLLERTHDE